MADTSGLEQTPAPAETAPQPVPGQQNAGAPAPARLTAADVAAALAATPMPKAPVVPPPSMPVSADDVDVVEPEWVAAAEQVMAQTAGNPYAEEEAFETLQVDYLKKRYGHEVKKPEDK
jgi:hypothetical protein